MASVDRGMRTGYVGMVGPANTGRSSLLNALVDKRISPVSKQPGTTRVPLTGLHMGRDFQACFVDTPPLDRNPDLEVLDWLDVVCVVVDARSLVEQLRMPDMRRFAEQSEVPSVCAVTFLDFFPAGLQPSFLNLASVNGSFNAVRGVCPPSGHGVDRLLSTLMAQLPKRGALFPEECMSLHSERFLVSELIRTQLYEVLPWRIADTTAVQIQEFSFRDGRTYVRANLHVSRHSNKGVVIGRKGRTLQEIVGAAGGEAQKVLGREVRLDLWVKVREAWPDTPSDLLEFGYVC
jgi:GTP-binding protein Era